MNKPEFSNLPDITPNSPLPPFKAWVQMALPTVFDDSLSYYELLSKVINYLNVTNEHLTNVDNNFSANNEVFVDTYNKIVTWFNELDLTAEVNTKVQSILDTWATDGTFDDMLVHLFQSDVINKTIETTNTWLNTHVTQETGYVLDDSLSVSNAAAPAKLVGLSIKNTIGGFFDTVAPYFIPNTGTGVTSRSDSLLYQYIELDKSKQNLIIYPKTPIAQCCISISFTNSKSSSATDYIRQVRYGNLFTTGGATYVRINAPIIIPYDINNNENYARVSIALPNDLSTITDKDLLYFGFNDNIVNRITDENDKAYMSGFDNMSLKLDDETLIPNYTATSTDNTKWVSTSIPVKNGIKLSVDPNITVRVRYYTTDTSVNNYVYTLFNSEFVTGEIYCPPYYNAIRIFVNSVTPSTSSDVANKIVVTRDITNDYLNSKISNIDTNISNTNDKIIENDKAYMSGFGNVSLKLDDETLIPNYTATSTDNTKWVSTSIPVKNGIKLAVDPNITVLVRYYTTDTSVNNYVYTLFNSESVTGEVYCPPYYNAIRIFVNSVTPSTSSDVANKIVVTRDITNDYLNSKISNIDTNISNVSLKLDNGFRNFGITYWDNNVANAEIGGAGYSTSEKTNSLLYQYITLDMSKNSLIIYPKYSISDCYVRASIVSNKNAGSEYLLSYLKRGTPSSRITFNSPLIINYDNTGVQKYLRVSITIYPDTTTLSPTNDRDILTFGYNNDIVDKKMNVIKEDILNNRNDIANIGIPIFSEQCKNQRLSTTEGSGVTDDNSILYGYNEIPNNFKNLILWCDDEIIYCRITFYSENNYTSFISTTRYDNPQLPITIPLLNEYKFMRISITANRNLDIETDKSLLKCCYSESTYFDETKFNVKNFIRPEPFETTEGHWILQNGTIAEEARFNYKTFNLTPYTDYELSITPVTTSSGVIRIHAFYDDEWLYQIFAINALDYSAPIIFNSQSANNIKISMNNIIKNVNVYPKKQYLLTGSKTLNLNGLNSFNLKGSKISILGASISSYDGTIPEGYSAYYPSSVSEGQQKVKCINDMYWKKFITIIGGELLVNNSSAGRTCSTYVSLQAPRAACGNACVSLHTTDGNTTVNPDIIIIQVGGNDFTSGAPLGDYNGTTPVPEDDSTSETPVNTKIFANAYAVMLNKILTAYPNAKVICGTIPPIRGTSSDKPQRVYDYFPSTRTTDNISLTLFNNKIKELAEAFGCYVCDFYGNGRTFQNIIDYTEDDRQHPNRKGMSLMCNALLNTLGQMNLNYFNV